MKILIGWILFSSLLSIAILFKAPDFLPIGVSSSQVINHSSKIELLDELMSHESIDLKLLKDKRLELNQAYKGSVGNAQLETLPITSLFFALLGLNKLNILLIVIYWFAIRKKKGPYTR